VIVCFTDIGIIVGYHCLNCFIINKVQTCSCRKLKW